VIRDLIKDENDLVNQRLGWLIQMEGLLFAALAFVWNRAPNGDAAPKGLTILLAFLGIATVVSLWSALSLYSPAIRDMKKWWEDHQPEGTIDEPEGKGVIGMWHPSEGIGELLRPWRALPIIFVTAWVGVLILSF